jgi:hypothetical protein
VVSSRILWHYFPKSAACPEPLKNVVSLFEHHLNDIYSVTHEGQNSNQVLEILRPALLKLGFEVESDKTKAGKIKVPVLFGSNGSVSKYFEADAYNKGEQIVIEVEAGRAVSNYQFLKDLFQACVMQDVDYALIAVRQDYRGGNDYEKVISFIDTLYASTKLVIPLKGLAIVGY